MRVLLASPARGIPFLGPSGASAHLRGVASALVRSGHEVVVALPHRTDARGAVAAVPEGVEVVDLPFRRGRHPRWRRELREEAHTAELLSRVQGTVDLVWQRHALHADAVARWARARGVPRWLELNAPLVLERDRTDPLALRERARRGEHASVRDADRVLAVSPWLTGWARAIGADTVTLLPQGTDHAGLGDRNATREALGLRGLVIGYVGSMKAWHRLDRLPALLEALPEAMALVVGDGEAPPPAHPRLMALPATPHLADRVAAFDVALAPGEAPPWVAPLKLADYRAQPVPIVASDVGHSRSMIGEAGEVLPPRSGIDAWVAAIRRQAGRRPQPAPVPWHDVVAQAFDGPPGVSPRG